MPILQKLFGRWTSRREVWIAVPCSATRLLHWTSCRQKVPNFGENYRPVPIPPWNHWKAASARLSTPKRPTTWCQAEIPKTLKHPKTPVDLTYLAPVGCLLDSVLSPVGCARCRVCPCHFTQALPRAFP